MVSLSWFEWSKYEDTVSGVSFGLCSKSFSSIIFPWIQSLSCYFAITVTRLNSCLSQGKEIIEFYLKELEDEGITQVPRWTPSSLPLPLPRPTRLDTSPPVLPELAVTPAVSIPLPTDAKDSSSQDTKQDNSALQADSLTDILAGTPEGLSQQMI